MSKKKGATKKKPVKEIKLDIGCGQNKPEGWVGIDEFACKGVDIVHDLTVFPWPIESNSVVEAQCIHVLEHIPGYHRMAFMAELWRVLKPEAVCKFQCPYYTSMRAGQDPTHQWPPISEASFFYFWKKWRVDNRIAHYLEAGECDFDVAWGYIYDPEVAGRTDDVRTFSVKNYCNAVQDIVAQVTKKVGR